jgi:hypothetical protein
MARMTAKKPKLSAEHKQVLNEVVIKEDSPGTIVKDFNMLLQSLGESGFPVTGTHQLPIRSLPEINSRMAFPIRHGLNRPQQKSYPHINGLFLLVRASELTFVGGGSKKPRLQVDQEMCQAWNSLIPTEQYCALLETWLLRGRPQIIGESDRGYYIPDHFREWMDFFKRIPKKGLQVAGNKDVEDWLRYAPGWHNLALFELFGLISVRSGSPVVGKGWIVDHLNRTPFGEALLALLLSEFFDDLQNIFELEDRKEVPIGVLLPALQPYFREWRNNPVAFKWVFRQGTHIFKVSLGNVWCRIAILTDLTLDALASAILAAVKFDDDHLYAFSYKSRSGALDRIHHSYMEEGPWTSEVLVGDLPLRVEQTMTFLFDFGDKWEFEVTLEQVDPDMTVEKPVLLEMHGEPPEQYPRWDED